VLTQAEIDGMRLTSASALPDTCTVTRSSDQPPTLDPDTLDSDPVPAETIYTGACRVRPRANEEQDAQVGDLHETLGPYVGTLPADPDHDGVTAGDPNDVRVDDYLVITASSDPSMVGRPFQVRHVGWSSWQIDRRIGLEDREQPQGIGSVS
jgi:hypothetical protein